MYNNLIPPFIIREAGLVVKDTKKVHAMDPSMDNHSTYFPNFDISITLFIHGVLSYFLTYNPPLAMIEGTYDIYPMTTGGRWNPVSYECTKSE